MTKKYISVGTKRAVYTVLCILMYFIDCMSTNIIFYYSQLGKNPCHQRKNINLKVKVIFFFDTGIDDLLHGY